ncbi:MAG: acetylxylan esterase [Planctomycetota bacterium]
MSAYHANDQLKVLDLSWETGSALHARMTTDFHRLLARRALAARFVPRTGAEVLVRSGSVRERLREALAVEPLPKTAPRAIRRIAFERPGVVVERVVLEAFPGWPLPALLYRPSNLRARAPAVLNVHGHTPRGKCMHDIQARGLGLARRGIVALCLDAVGMGERAGQGHHSGFFLPMMGLSLQGLLVRDNLRAFEFLRGLPFVDPARIGITGHSGGGNQSMYTAALEPRIAAAVPAMSVSTFEDLVFRGIGCACEVIPGLMPDIDIPDVLSLVAPRPCLVLSGTRDETFPILGAWTAFERSKPAWRLLGAESKFEFEEVYVPHTYDAPVRDRMFEFFERTLLGRKGAFRPEAVPTVTEPEDSTDLDAFPGGRLPKGSRTLGELFRGAAAPVLAASVREPASAVRERLRKALHLPVPLRARSTLAGTIEGDGVRIEKWILESESGILLPSLLLLPPASRGPLPAVLWLHPEGKNRAIWSADARRILARGAAVLALDLRGTGETENLQNPKACPDARNGLVLGRPLPGQHVADVEAALGFLARHPRTAGRRVNVAGTGYGGFVAVLSAAAGLELGAVAADRMPSDFVWKGGMAPDLRLVIPGLAAFGGPAGISGLCAPRPLMLSRPVSFEGSALLPAEAARALAPATAAYRRARAAKAFRIVRGGSAEIAEAAAAFLVPGPRKPPDMRR